MIRFDGEGVNPDLFDADIAALTGSNGEVGATMLGIPLCDTQSILQLCLQFFINILVCFVIVRYFYYPKSRRKDFAVTFVLFSTAVFLLLFFMKSVGIDVSIGLGLFITSELEEYPGIRVKVGRVLGLFVNGLAAHLQCLLQLLVLD